MKSQPLTGDSDRDFALAMRAQHQGAIDIAQTHLASAKDPQIRRLAHQIIAAQKKDLALIDRWLKQRNVPRPSTPPQ